ncbi:Amino Acid/Auxin Permease (AAAP) Family [Achlya hypogyna]|uniref:Amino Acid/Auxin Permease (AAAP) Family n=1 Tax=Achlya hypogyna TaxID=1202772 RepID=A0A1V9ZBG9_ACHHY|nr:Amino Acid/Auxin Permease (AAAP) Family [Achlya hypogyna]
MSKPFFTIEDTKMAFSLFCVVCGIGTLSMPGNYARAGYVWATIALVFMASINVYASVCISKVMLVAPKECKTLGDIGGWVFGTPGRVAINISHMLVCVMAPIMFLVLGGTILTVLFPDSYSDSTWIILMGLSLLPVCLVPTLKESAGTATAGALGVVFADVIAIYLLIANIEVPDVISPPAPDLTFEGITTVFGSLSLAYAAGIIIPSLQREHSDPSRMPRVITCTLTLVSVCFLIVAVLGDYKLGCQIPGNLLFAITGTKLGFTASRGGVILSFLFMHLHIMIAFALVLFPAMFMAERIILGMHKSTPKDAEIIDLETPKDMTEDHLNHEDPAAAYKAPGAYAKAAVLRTIMVAICVVIAIAFKDKFGDLMDFVGASATATCCMILPIAFYLKTFYSTLSLPEKAFGVFSILITTALAIYVSIKTGINLFSPSEGGVTFPYCPEAFQHYVPFISLFTCPCSAIMAFLTMEDMKMCFSLFCVVYGIGTLGMPGNYARAGYVWATIALVFMASINIYASVCISKVMMVAPSKVQTLGDIGEWVFGKTGRWVTNIAQMLVCTMVPIVFLVLGGTLLTVLFPMSYADSTWIALMGLSLLPVCLIPTLKEGAGTAAAGALGTVLADIIALYILVDNMTPVPSAVSPPSPVLTFGGVTAVFGNLSLAYGAGIIIPSLQREHSNPARMPRVITCTLGFISLLFLIISITGVSTVGCQIPGNLLFAITGDKLGFQASRGGVVLAFLFMQLHITIAFALVLFPAMFIAERIVLGLHKEQFTLEPSTYIDAQTPAVKDAERLEEATMAPENHTEPSEAYKAPGAYLKAVILRTVMVVLCVVIAIIFKNKFSELLDFVGASSTALCCMILPIAFYLRTFYTTLSLPEKAFAVLSIAVTSALAIYVTVNTGKALFAPEPAGARFPFCAAEFQNYVYTNKTHYNSFLVLPSAFSMAFLTLEDLKTCFSLFCVAFGIGSLGMPGNYARAGYVWASIALVFMAAINMYASVCMSKVMLVAPKGVQTLGDIGEWIFGRTGRWITVIAHMLVCVMVPIVFLVLGGTLLTVLFPDSYADSTWIALMGISLLPVCLIPTLKDGAGALGTILADIIALYILVDNTTPMPSGISPPSPMLSFGGVTTVFGNLSLAFGCGTIIPSLQLEHSRPERMPRVIMCTITLTAVLFLIISITGDFTMGCQIPGNLLFAIIGDSLGFTASRGGIILSFLLMQLHITIAFALVLFPAMFIAERLFLGLHKEQFALDEENYGDLETPAPKTDEKAEGADVAPVKAEVAHRDPADAYKAPGAYLKAAVLRTVMVVLCVVIAIVFKNKFSDLLDFVGASATSLCCTILPIIFYLRTFFHQLSIPEKGFAIFSILIVSALAIYVSVHTGKALFSPEPPSARFPFCEPAFQDYVYTNRTHYNAPFLTIEDLKMCFSLFCVAFGIGSLGMPGNYARAGYVWATVALAFMAAINMYALVCISHVMLVAPKRVQTLGDMGEWVFGKAGRWVTVITHMLVCTMVPIVFLVLGGTLLTPERMPRVIKCTIAVITALFLVISITGDFTMGCQIPGNLLFAIIGDSLGFTASRGGIILSFLFMQLHISIAFALVLFPAMFIAERLILGLHKNAFSLEGEEVAEYGDITTPEPTDADVTPVKEVTHHDHDPADAYKAPGAYLKAAVLRTIMVVLCVVIAIVFKNKFSDLLDFVGASATSLCCTILPIAFYLRTFRHTMGLPEKVFAVVAIVVTSALAIYVSINTGKALFSPQPPGARFPHCAAEYQDIVYTNRTHYKF